MSCISRRTGIRALYLRRPVKESVCVRVTVSDCQRIYVKIRVVTVTARGFQCARKFVSRWLRTLLHHRPIAVAVVVGIRIPDGIWGQPCVCVVTVTA